MREPLPSSSRRLSRLTEIFLIVNLIVATCTLMLLVAVSLSWPLLHDSPILFYLARQIVHYDKLPYQELFDMNMPATYFLYALLDILSFHSATALRLIDIGLLIVLSVISSRIVPTGGKWERMYAMLMFPIVYLALGPRLSLQREYLALIPLSIAGYCILNPDRRSASLTFFVFGLGFGCAAAIKPHLLIGLPFAIACMLTPSGKRTLVPGSFPNFWIVGLPLMAAGILIPLAATIAYVLVIGVHKDFLDLWSRYLPLYGQITYSLTILPSDQQTNYHLFHMIWGNFRFPLLILGFVALGFHFRAAERWSQERFRILFLGSQCLAYWLYPRISGQYWYYHWLPLTYWMIIALSSLSTLDRHRFPGFVRTIGAVLLLAWTFTLAQSGMKWVSSKDPPAFARARLANDLATYLKKNLQADDSVQPLDWTQAGLVHGLYLADARLATSFVYEFHFYHHTSTPYIMALRDRFLTELRSNRPRFIIEGLPGPPYLRGPDTSESFEALKQFVDSHYRLVHQGPVFLSHRRISYRVWEKLDAPLRSSANGEPPHRRASPLAGKDTGRNIAFREFEF